MKKLLLTFLVALPFVAGASNITLLPPVEPSFFSKVFSKIQNCTWRVSCYFQNNVGSTITTILGSDTLSASRTVINTNFSNLNTDKFETTGTTLASLTSASSLATVGTITSGTWNATTIGVPYGGTGSTTLASNQVLLGNGTGNVKVVSGFGTSGQFLTSNGTAAAPTWQTSSVNQNDNYAWTGNHNFTGTTLIKNLNASSTSANPIVLNGISLNTPSTQGAASTTLMNDGSGNLSWLGFVKKLTTLPTINQNCSTAGAASTTVYSMTVPANTLGTTNGVRVKTNLITGNYGSTDVIWFDVGYGNASTTMFVTVSASTFGNNGGDIEVSLLANGATNSQRLNMSINDIAGAKSALGASLTQDSTTEKQLTLVSRSITNGPLTCGNTIAEIIQ